MARQRNVFDGDKIPRGFHETSAKDEAFLFDDYAEELAEAAELGSEEEIQAEKDKIQEMNDELREQEIAEMSLTPEQREERDQKQMEWLRQRIEERKAAKAAKAARKKPGPITE